MYKVSTISDVRAANRAAGFHFFDRATIRFFGSSVVSTLYKNLCFVTRELDYNGTQYLYTVRQFDPETAQIETVGNFQQYTTIQAARAAAKIVPAPAPAV